MVEPRTTPALVKSICDQCDLTTIGAYIETANNYVTNVLAGAGYDAVTLELIERWTAAHFWRADKPMIVEQKIGEAQDNYGIRPEDGFRGTQYGRVAMSLDWQGLIARQDAMNKKGAQRKVVGVLALGTHWGQRQTLVGPRPFPPPYPGPPSRNDL